MMHKLPPLPFARDALIPHISAETLDYHHGKHHQAYVNNVNKALEGTSGAAGKSIEDVLRDIESVPEEKRQAVINNGGGHANHSLFWQIMSPSGGGEPSGDLGKDIKTVFGGFSEFKERFSNAAATRFGSGWAWLAVGSDGSLKVYSTPNQDSPYMQGDTPIIGLDVWEHAYYLNYQNRRPDYIAAFFKNVDWKAAEARLK